jgi:hypothetical protein
MDGKRISGRLKVNLCRNGSSGRRKKYKRV